MLESSFFNKVRNPLTLLTKDSSDVANYLPDNTVSHSKTQVLIHIAVTVNTSHKTHCGLTTKSKSSFPESLKKHTNALIRAKCEVCEEFKAGGVYVYGKRCALKG
jgi:hypothetical protein